MLAKAPAGARSGQQEDGHFGAGRQSVAVGQDRHGVGRRRGRELMAALRSHGSDVVPPVVRAGLFEVDHVPGLFDDDGPATWDVGVLATADLPGGFDDTLVAVARAGDADVTVTVYPGARHEILNETNRDRVTADVVGWLTSHLPG